jgi:hypothetical protein
MCPGLEDDGTESGGGLRTDNSMFGSTAELTCGESALLVRLRPESDGESEIINKNFF